MHDELHNVSSLSVKATASVLPYKMIISTVSLTVDISQENEDCESTIHTPICKTQHPLHDLSVRFLFKECRLLKAGALTQPAPQPVIQQCCEFSEEVPRAVHFLQTEASQVHLIHWYMGEPDLQPLPSLALTLLLTS